MRSFCPSLLALWTLVLVRGERMVKCPGLGNFTNEKPWNTLLRPVPPSQCKSNMKFLLLTRMNIDNPLQLSRRYSSIEESPYDSSRWTVFLIHGWLSRPETFISIAQRYLSCVDANIFVVDYREVAANKNYFQAVSDIRVVAARMAQFVEFLIEEKGACKCMFHLVGMSLGAHLAAYVCKIVRGLQRLTGLDPAGPLFNYKEKAVRLTRSDAKFVEVIHTNMQKLGLRISSDADINFIINDGKKQPGCSGILHNGCSHSRALSLYFYSICSKSCTFVGFDSRNNQTGERDCVPMSLDTMYYRNRGQYYVRTTEKAPYCLRNYECQNTRSDY